MIDIDQIIADAEAAAATPVLDPGAALRLTLEVLSDLLFIKMDTVVVDPTWQLAEYKAARVLEVSNMATFEDYDNGKFIVRKVQL